MATRPKALAHELSEARAALQRAKRHTEDSKSALDDIIREIEDAASDERIELHPVRVERRLVVRTTHVLPAARAKKTKPRRSR